MARVQAAASRGMARERASDQAPAPNFRLLRNYVALTKPRVMALLLLTGFCGLVAGAGGLVEPDLCEKRP